MMHFCLVTFCWLVAVQHPPFTLAGICQAMSSHPPPCKYDATALYRCQSTEDYISVLGFARLLVQPGSYERNLVDFNYFCLALKMKTILKRFPQ